MGGFCPGTSCVAADTGKADGLAVMTGMFFGIIVFNETYGLVIPFYRSTSMGQITLPELLGLPFGTVVFGIVILGLLAFKASQWIESSR